MARCPAPGTRPGPLSLVLTLLVFFFGCSDGSDPIDGRPDVPGSGFVVEERRTVGSFSKLTFATQGDLQIEQGAQEALLVRAEDNLQQYLLSTVQGDRLVLQTASGVDLAPTRPIVFELTVVDLDDVVLSGVGDIEATAIVEDRFSLTLSGVGTIECLALDATDLEVDLTGVGNIELAGSVDVQTVAAIGVGDYFAEDLVSREARLTLTREGKATVRVSDLLVITFVNGGSVEYIGDPQLQVTGTGTLNKIG
jgi:hypothetical protein